MISQLEAPLSPEMLDWFDRRTGRRWLIDKRTGNSWLPDENIATTGDSEGGSIKRTAPRNIILERKKLRRNERSAEEKSLDAVSTSSALRGAQPSWLETLLEDWKNPVFPDSGSALPTVEAIVQSTSQVSGDPDVSHQLRKEDLHRLQFIRQVDQKFLLCTLLIEDGKLCILLVDQHAADERIRVESLLRTYCSDVQRVNVDVFTFLEPRPILLTMREVEAIRQRIEAFRRWGFELDIRQQASDTETGQIFVKTIPTMVLDRLGTDARLMQQLIKQHVADLLAGNVSDPHNGPERPWSSMLRQCPAVLVDLINSKACRGELTLPKHTSKADM